MVGCRWKSLRVRDSSETGLRISVDALVVQEKNFISRIFFFLHQDTVSTDLDALIYIFFVFVNM